VEGFAKPLRTRRHLARLLVAEIRMNDRQIEWLPKERRQIPDFLPLNVSFSTRISAAAGEQVGEQRVRGGSGRGAVPGDRLPSPSRAPFEPDAGVRARRCRRARGGVLTPSAEASSRARL
jgi:hypothetical protein